MLQNIIYFFNISDLNKLKYIDHIISNSGNQYIQTKGESGMLFLLALVFIASWIITIIYIELSMVKMKREIKRWILDNVGK